MLRRVKRELGGYNVRKNRRDGHEEGLPFGSVTTSVRIVGPVARLREERAVENRTAFFTKFLALSFLALVRATGILAVIGIVSGSPAQADMYFNSAEPGCDGSNPNYLMCEDFESGAWYGKDCDKARSSGGLSQTNGWCGNIYSNPIEPPGAVSCGGAGVGGTGCAANGGLHTGNIGGVNMADHNFAPNISGYNEIYLRYYIKPLPGYVYGAQKMITINATPAGGGGISIGGVGSPFQDGNMLACPVYDCNITNKVYYYRPNMASALPLGSLTGRWAFVEIRVKLNAPGQANGVYELWMDDCGTDGLACSGTPTLRARHTTVQWQGPTDNKQIMSVWFENWANPPSFGTELYDQIIVSKTGPIGFMRSGASLRAPSGLTVK